MIHPDGSASLAVRRSYLKRRHAAHLGDRGSLAAWVTVATVMLISALGLLGLGH